MVYGDNWNGKGFSMRSGNAGALVPYSKVSALKNQGIGYLENGLQYAKGVGSKLANYVSGSALPAATRFAATKTGLGTLAGGAYALGDYMNSDQPFNGANNPDPRYTIQAPMVGDVPASAVAKVVPKIIPKDKVVQPTIKKNTPLSNKTLPPLMDANGNLIQPPAPLGEKPTSAMAKVVENPTVLPIEDGINQDVYGTDFNNANRYAGYGEASVGGNVHSPNSGNATDSFWGNLTRAGGYSAQDWNAMSNEDRIKAGALKSNLASGMEQFGQVANGASALAGIYGTMQNAKYLKNQTKMQEGLIADDKSRQDLFAKNAGAQTSRVN